jgi:hypothetical protein
MKLLQALRVSTTLTARKTQRENRDYWSNRPGDLVYDRAPIVNVGDRTTTYKVGRKHDQGAGVGYLADNERKPSMPVRNSACPRA